LNNASVAWPSGTIASNQGGSNPASEGPAKAIDSSTSTKWLDFNFNTAGANQTYGNSNLSIDTKGASNVTFNG